MGVWKKMEHALLNSNAFSCKLFGQNPMNDSKNEYNNKFLRCWEKEFSKFSLNEEKENPGERTNDNAKALKNYVKHIKDFHVETVDTSDTNFVDTEYETPCQKSSYFVSRCVKGRHHGNSFGFDEFSKESIPLKEFRNESILQLVKSLRQLVVKVKVKGQSPNRKSSNIFRINPLPGTAMGKVRRQGTGWLSALTEEDVPELFPCQDASCIAENGSHDVIGTFYVITARHLVYDHIEAQNTSIEFVSDDSDLPSWKAEGVSIALTPYHDRDFVYVKCVSHDLEIFQHIRSSMDRIPDSVVKNATVCLGDNDVTRQKNKLVFIISHPHGKPKRVTFGKVTKEEESEKDVEIDAATGKKRSEMVMFTYGTPTCPGSSGAPVCIVGQDDAKYFLFPHRERDGGCLGGKSLGLVDWDV